MRADLHARAARLARLSPRVLLLVGGPGSGKGVVSAALSASGWHAVSAGDKLRAAAMRDAAVANTLRRGGVVPGVVSAAVVLSWMEARVAEGVGGVDGLRWVVDGFPRSLESARVWEEAAGPVWGFLELEVGRAELERRLASRGREDDSAEIVHSRIDWHEREMPALREFYAARGVYGRVDGEGPLEEVAARARLWIDAHAVD